MFLISDDCSFTRSGQIIIQPKQNVEGFSPKYLFGLNATLVKPRKLGLDLHKIGNSASLGFVAICISIFCIILCVKVSYRQTDIQYTYVAPTETYGKTVCNIMLGSKLKIPKNLQNRFFRQKSLQHRTATGAEVDCGWILRKPRCCRTQSQSLSKTST